MPANPMELDFIPKKERMNLSQQVRILPLIHQSFFNPPVQPSRTGIDTKLAIAEDVDFSISYGFRVFYGTDYGS